MCLISEMNTFSENPLFLFVDDLVDGSADFATEGKIVELFDTGCDARTPGDAFKIAKEPDAIIQINGSIQNNIPNVRKPSSLSQRRDKTPLKRNTRPAGHKDIRQNITGISQLPKQIKPTTWNPKSKDKISTKSNGTEVKSGLNSVVGNQSDAKGSEYCKRVGGSLDQQKGKLNSTHTWMSSKYGEINRTVKSQSISLSIPKQYKVPEARSMIYSTFEDRAKKSPSKSVTTSKVTSEAVLNNGLKKFVSRAVDKDSLSNCSRQLETAKTSGAPLFSKTGYASRLPRSAGAAKFLVKEKPHSEFPVPIESAKQVTIKPEDKTDLMEIAGGTNHELQDKTRPTVNLEKRRDRPEGETPSKVTLVASPTLISQRKYGDNVKAKLPTKTCDVDNRNTMTMSSSRPKMTVSKVPLPTFNRSLLIVNKSVQKLGSHDEISNVHAVSDARNSKSNERLSSKMEKIDVARCPDSEDKSSASKRPNACLEKVLARPSAKCHNLTKRESDAQNTTMSFQTKLSKTRTTSTVPKLMNEFRLQEKTHNEVSKCSPGSMAVPSVSPKVKLEDKKSKTETIKKPPCASGILSNQLNERVSRFSDRVQKVLNSNVPLLSGVTQCTEINHRSVDCGEQSKSTAETKPVSSSGITAVKENDEEIELETIFEDTSVTASCKPTPESSTGHLAASRVNESKLRHPPPCPLATGSKVPRPVVTKRIPRKELVQNSSVRTWSKKPESCSPQGALKSSVKSGAKREAKPSIPPVKHSVEDVQESKNVTKMSAFAKEDEDEDVIPIMIPAHYNIHSFATHYRKRGSSENAVPQETAHERKVESWIDGHEQAYLKGRAIGLKVASMARAAQEDLKCEFVRSGLKNTIPIPLPDKSQEIVDIGVSVIEKVLAGKDNKIYMPSVRVDRTLNYHDFDTNIKWKTKQWFM